MLFIIFYIMDSNQGKKITFKIKQHSQEQQKKQSNNKPFSKPKQSKRVQPIKPRFKKKEQIKKTNDEIHTVLRQVKDSLQNEDIKRIKKCLLEIDDKADKIGINYDISKPNIVITYSSLGKQSQISLNKLISVNNHLAKNRQLISRIFTTFYSQVNNKYFDIALFGLQYCDIKRVQFKGRSLREFIKTKKELLRSQYYFYFRLSMQKIYFLLFDSWMNSIEFNSDDIEAIKHKNEEAYLQYRQFLKREQKNLGADEQLRENFGQDEVQSDEESRKLKVIKRKQPEVQQLRRKIKNLINTDVQKFEDAIEQKNDRVSKLQETNSSRELVLKLADEVMEENNRLENFIEIRDKIKVAIQQNFDSKQKHVEWLKKCLKRIILAEKQLTSNLPIIARKRVIFEELNKKNLLIIQGETGSGKSTQLPQILCQYFKILQDQKALPVLITQPRKLATRTLAQRVASQMDEQVHGFVDYQTSLTSQINDKAKIIFKMDRLVLDELKVDPILSKYSCLVIDEAHQRTISIDLILGFIKNLLNIRKDFKVIVTSASMDIELFEKYFQTKVLKVSGRMFPVKEIFTPYTQQQDTTRKIKKVINEHLLDDRGRNLRQEYRGHVLVFCTGVDQITQLVAQFKNKLNQVVFSVLALHGKLTPEQQREVFLDTHKNKIIFSSRIAQTSVTINKVRVVVDPGEDRQLVYDQKTKITSLILKKISKSSAKQRAGRAGRTNEGFCFRLYTERERNQQPISKTPEIQNMTLDTVVLRLKSLEIDNIVSFPYISPPSKQGLLNSIETMKMINCIDPQTQKITSIGEFLVKIPIQPFLARAIVQAMLFDNIILKKPIILQRSLLEKPEKQKIKQISFTGQIIKILCLIVSSSNLFYIPVDERQHAEKIKYEKLSDMDGDFFYLLNIYNAYLNQNRDTLKKWAFNHYLSLKTLNSTKDLERQIRQISKQFDKEVHNLSQFEHTKVEVKLSKNVKTVKQIILSCLVTSFATNLALYSNKQQIGYTIISNQTPITIYGTSTLSLQGISPKWILFYDLIQNEKGNMYCKIANSIDFQFLLKNTNQYILKKYKIKEAGLKNPFYQSFSWKLPSLVYQDVQSDYQKRFFQTNNEVHFLQNYAVSFHEETNQIQIFFQKSKTLPNNSIFSSLMHKFEETMVNLLSCPVNFQKISDLRLKFDTYLNGKKKRYEQIYTYNYVGPVFIDLQKGFNLKEVRFNVNEHHYTLTGNNQALHLIRQYCGIFGSYQMFPGKIIFKIVQQKSVRQFENLLNILIYNLGQQHQKINLSHCLEDKRKKIPQTKLYMHFWAGQSQKNNLYLTYDKNEDYQKRGPQYLQQMCKLLNKIPIGVNNPNPSRRRNNNVFVIAKSRKGINYYGQQGFPLDEFQLREILQRYSKQNQKEYGFRIPTAIKKFRDPDIANAAKTEKEWEKNIIDLLNRQGISQNSIAVRVWGIPYYRKEDKNIGEYEKSFKVQLHAEVKGYDLKSLNKFQEKYDKKKGIIGNEKVHCKFEFEQVAAITNLNAFNALKDDFQQLVESIKLQNPQVTVEFFQKKAKKLTKIYIKVRCSNRDELIHPSFRINNLFSPKLIPMDIKKFRYLDKTDPGNQILQDIQNKYKYKIYFAFDRKLNSIKLYCEDADFKKIQEDFNQKLSQVKVYEQQISYRGKNLNKVKQIIQQFMQTLKGNKFLNYEVMFKDRKLRLIGDGQSCDFIKNQILKITINKQKKQCQICSSLIQKPYRLFNCSHEFCWSCLASCIRQNIGNSTTNETVKCPECAQLISVHDVFVIMSEEQFNKLCDIKISRYIEKDPKYHGCPSPNCQNIFLTEISKKNQSFQCQLCGKWYCFKCKKNHLGYTCQDWENKLDLNLSKLGIKKCRKCGQGIQKNQGCQHVECIKCKAHICWTCQMTFQTSRQCYDHLAKDCGGIFRN